MHGILIADDNRVLTMVLESLLSSMSYKVVGIAHSGNEAIALAREHRPDLVLMDIAMPGELDGIDASEIMKRELNIPVVFLSTLTDSDCLDRAIKVDPLGYVQKPFSPQQIRATIKMAIHRLKRQKEETNTNRALDLMSIGQCQLFQKTDGAVSFQTEETAQCDGSTEFLRDPGGNGARLEAGMVSLLEELLGAPLNEFRENDQGIPQVIIEKLQAVLNDSLGPLFDRFPKVCRPFSRTELRIARFLRDGLSSKEIAANMGVSPSTVIWHRKNIRKKLGITNTEQTVTSHLSKENQPLCSKTRMEPMRSTVLII